MIWLVLYLLPILPVAVVFLRVNEEKINAAWDQDKLDSMDAVMGLFAGCLWPVLGPISLVLWGAKYERKPGRPPAEELQRQIKELEEENARLEADYDFEHPGSPTNPTRGYPPHRLH